MKKIVLGVVLAFNFTVANATSLGINSASSVFSFSGYDGQPKTVTGAKSYGVTGTLTAATAGTISFTYLGQESGYLDSFKFNIGGLTLKESDPLGKTISMAINAGDVPFSFMDDVNKDGTVEHVFSNGTTSTGAFGFAFLMNKIATNSYAFAQNATISSGVNAGKYTFDYLLGFNDHYVKSLTSNLGDSDYDDFVVGVRFTPSPVPLPAAAWLFGSALLGFVSLSNRRKA